MTPTLQFSACAASAWQSLPDTPLRALTGGGLVVLSTWAMSRRPFPGQRAFGALCGVMALWMAASVLEHAAVALPCKTSIALVSWPAILAQPPLWVLFLYQYLYSETRRPGWRMGFVYATPALVMMALALGNGAHGLLYGPATELTAPIAGAPRVRYDYGSLFYAAVAMGYGWMLLAYVLALRGWWQSPRGRRGQWGAFLVLMSVPLVANLAYVGFGWRLFGADPTSLAFAVVLSGFAWMASRTELFTLVPLARRLLFDDLPDALLIVDGGGRVVEANRAAQALVGAVPPLGTPLPHWPRIGEALQERLRPGAPAQPLALERPAQFFEVQQRALEDAGAAIGTLVQLHDVTASELERRRVRARLAQQEAEQAALREQALRDPLTGLLNRRAQEQRFAEGVPPQTALVMLDLDHFKRVNDLYGHATGDEVLRAFAAELRAAVRSGDEIFRIGGEEFALLLPGLDAAQAQQRMQALHAQLDAQRLAGLAYPLGFSAGVVDAQLDGQGLHGVLAAADEAMYRAKAAGRGRTLLALAAMRHPRSAVA